MTCPRFLRSLCLSSAALVVACGGDGGSVGPDAGPDPMAPTYPPAFEVDPELEPQRDTVSALEDSGPRPVARVSSEYGPAADFVENEVLIGVDSPAALDAFLDRWNGEVLGEVDFEAAGVDEPTMAIVRVDATGMATDQLGRDIIELEPMARGAHRVSSDEGLALMALAAHERANEGLDVGLNWILAPHDLGDRSTQESPTGADANDGTAYSPDPADWPYMARGTTQDIGVIEAWRVLEQTGRTDAEVPIAIADGGFAELPHLPTDDTIYPPGAWLRQNEWGCGPGNPCPWHGTDVAGAAFGSVDDGRGAAGPAGPVAHPIYLQSPSKDVAAVLKHIVDTIRALGAGAPPIVNISAGGWVPAAAGVLANQAVSGLGVILRGFGVLTIASAGNDGDPVDSEDCAEVCAFGGCLGGCWETGSHIPCESSEVLCVGGLDWDSTDAHPSSNWGVKDTRSVDLWAPYEVWTGPTVGSSGVDTVTGTSFSAPFVSGVAGLVLAADPSLGPEQLEQVLFRTAHPGEGRVSRRIDAFAAIQDVYGGDVPPHANILQPDDGDSLAGGQSFTLRGEADDPEGVTSSRWLSDRDGEILRGAFSLDVDADLAYGTHVLTLEVTDDAGQVTTDSVEVEVTNQPPTVEILSPDSGDTFFATESVGFRASGSDSNESLPDSAFRWSSSLDGPLGTGPVLTAGLSIGDHLITLEVVDRGGESAVASLTLTIDPAPSNPPPRGVRIVEPEVDPATGEAAVLSAVTEESVFLSVRAAATDPDGENLTFEWFTDRTDLQPAALGTGQDTSVELFHGDFVECYDHRITLIVTDEAGQSREDVIDVCVLPNAG